MSETSTGQVTFGFGLSVPSGEGWERSGGRTAAVLEAGGQKRGRRSLDAPQGRARLSQRVGGGGLAGERQPTPGAELRWLTAKEATSYLSFPTRKALYAAVERGQVPAHKLGRRLRFRLEELDALLGRAR